MDKLIKNLEHAVPLQLKNQVSYETGKVVSLTLTQKPTVGMTLFAFDEGEGIGTHAASGDAFVTILEGTARITVGEQVFEVSEGNSIVMPATIPHSLKALTPFKMLLVVVKP